MSSTQEREALAQALLERGNTLADRVLSRMYQDPFWHARFGERADVHGRQDQHFHLSYVAQALRAEDAAIVERYATWLRGVLVSRGMCTRHLRENFVLLADAVAAEGLPNGEWAVALLGHAENALVHEDEAAREVQARASALASAAVARVRTAHPEWGSGYAEDASLHLEYVADALAMGRPELFGEHVVFMARFAEAHRRVPRAAFRELLAALRKGLEDAELLEAAAIVEAGIARLDERVAGP